MRLNIAMKVFDNPSPLNKKLAAYDKLTKHKNKDEHHAHPYFYVFIKDLWGECNQVIVIYVV